VYTKQQRKTGITFSNDGTFYLSKNGVL